MEDKKLNDNLQNQTSSDIATDNINTNNTPRSEKDTNVDDANTMNNLKTKTNTNTNSDANANSNRDAKTKKKTTFAVNLKRYVNCQQQLRR